MNERLNKLDNSKLIDVVKNYQQYGYDENIRKIALDILKNRGIDEDDLKLTGNYINISYERAKEISKDFSRNSRTAFFLYIFSIIARISLSIYGDYSEVVGWILIILTFLSIIFYIIFLLMSVMNHVEFYKSIGKELGTGYIFMYVIVGMPFYLFLYFYYMKQMKEEMRLIQ